MFFLAWGASQTGVRIPADSGGMQIRISILPELTPELQERNDDQNGQERNPAEFVDNYPNWAT